MADATNPLLAALSGQGGPSIDPSQVQNQPPPDVQNAPPPQETMTQNQPITAPPTAQQQLKSATTPGLPAIVSLIGQMIHPTGQVQSGQMPRPPSRLDEFEKFLGNFSVSLAQGMAASGHGPGANIRGAAGAMLGPREMGIQNAQLQQQSQEEAARTAQTQAQTAQIQSQMERVPVRLPDGTMVQLPANIAKTMIDAQQQAAARTNVQVLKNTGAQNVQASKAAVAAKSLEEKTQEFQAGTAYKTWKTKFDAENQQKIAQMKIDAQKMQQNLTNNKAPAAMMQTAVFAGGGLRMMQDADAAMQRLEQRGVMGSLPANKVQDWIFGKGLVDPSLDAQTRQDIGTLRAALGYTSSAAMRAHTGRTSNEIYQDFKARLGAGQDWSALRGAMDETKTLLTDYASAASDASIQSIRQGTNVPGGGAPAAARGGTRPPGWK